MVNYDDSSDFEINTAVTCEVYGCHVWSFSENGEDCAFYHCGVDGEGYYEQPVVDYCNNFDDWYKLADKYGMSLDVSGRASIPKSISGLDHMISHTCEGKLGRAVSICVLKLKDAENDR